MGLRETKKLSVRVCERVREERFPCVSEHIYHGAVILGDFFSLLQQSGGGL
jgi:hypothetical protein